MYVCMCICMCMCVCVYVYICMRINLYACTCMDICICVYMCIYVCICVYVCMCVCMCVSMRPCVYVCMCAARRRYTCSMCGYTERLHEPLSELCNHTTKTANFEESKKKLTMSRNSTHQLVSHEKLKPAITLLYSGDEKPQAILCM